MSFVKRKSRKSGPSEKTGGFGRGGPKNGTSSLAVTFTLYLLEKKSNLRFPYIINSPASTNQRRMGDRGGPPTLPSSSLHYQALFLLCIWTMRIQYFDHDERMEKVWGDHVRGEGRVRLLKNHSYYIIPCGKKIKTLLTSPPKSPLTLQVPEMRVWPTYQCVFSVGVAEDQIPWREGTWKRGTWFPDSGINDRPSLLRSDHELCQDHRDTCNKIWISVRIGCTTTHNNNNNKRNWSGRSDSTIFDNDQRSQK